MKRKQIEEDGMKKEKISGYINKSNKKKYWKNKIKGQIKRWKNA